MEQPAAAVAVIPTSAKPTIAKNTAPSPKNAKHASAKKAKPAMKPNKKDAPTDGAPPHPKTSR